jgi:hypothetical protein
MTGALSEQRGSDARAECLRALEERFGWLRDELYKKRAGNVSSLEANKQILWHARTQAVAHLNRISELRDAERRERAYRKLTQDLKARRS